MGGEHDEEPYTQIRADGKRYPTGQGPDVYVIIPPWAEFLASQGVDVPNLLTSISVSAAAPWPPLNRLLDTVGDGSGVTNAIGDYSVTAETFLIAPGPGEVFEIHALGVEIQTSSGGNSIRPNRYGDIVGGLSVGLDIYTHNGISVVEEITEAGSPILDNRDWIRYAFDVSTETDNQTGFIHINWDFGDAAITISGDATEELRVGMNDDLSQLVGHTFTAKGVVIS